MTNNLDREPLKQTSREVLGKMVAFLLGGFSFVAALAWNDAVQSLFKVVFPEGSSVLAKFIYAAAVTLVITLVSLRLARYVSSDKKE